MGTPFQPNRAMQLAQLLLLAARRPRSDLIPMAILYREVISVLFLSRLAGDLILFSHIEFIRFFYQRI